MSRISFQVSSILKGIIYCATTGPKLVDISMGLILSLSNLKTPLMTRLHFSSFRIPPLNELKSESVLKMVFSSVSELGTGAGSSSAPLQLHPEFSQSYIFFNRGKSWIELAKIISSAPAKLFIF